MLNKLIRYLRSERFKNKVYMYGTTTLMLYVVYLVFTINKPMFKPTRAETGGYENYDPRD